MSYRDNAKRIGTRWRPVPVGAATGWWTPANPESQTPGHSSPTPIAMVAVAIIATAFIASGAFSS